MAPSFQVHGTRGERDDEDDVSVAERRRLNPIMAESLDMSTGENEVESIDMSSLNGNNERKESNKRTVRMIQLNCNAVRIKQGIIFSSLLIIMR